jgi:primosomal protein N' (replication factor Y)
MRPPAPALVVARVVPDVTGLDKSFDYLVPPPLAADVGAGAIVRVPLHGRRVRGWVRSVGPPDPGVPIERLLALAKVVGRGPTVETVELAEWAARRWAGRLRALLVTASPPTVVATLPAPDRSTVPVPGPHPADALALLGTGGGVLRRGPSEDPLPVVLAACTLGPVLVVVPSVAAAGMLGARLRRAGRTVATLPDGWAAAAGGVDVVIGARAAVWGPVAGLAGVVVIDEHDEALQEERTPTWHARDVAIERARRAGVPCLLVSPVPSLAALAWAGDRMRVPARVDERASWPVLEVVDRTREEPWQRSLVTPALVRHLRDRSKRVVCVLNTTGRARLLACRSCRALQRCERCDAAVHQDDVGSMCCSRCGLVRPPVCQACGASAFATLRPGVTRLREELEAAANRPVAAVTGASDDVVPDVDVLVGTEAVLHRVRDVDVVAFLDLDAELLAPRYRAAELSVALLARAARLVGPRAHGGRLLVQTHLPRHEVIDAVLHADPGRLARTELERRRALGFPPARALAVVSGTGADAFAAELRAAPALQVSGPADGRWLVRAGGWDELGAAISGARRPKGSRLRIEVDPPRL